MLRGKNVLLRAIKSEDLIYLNTWRNDLKNKIQVQGFRLPVTIEMDEIWYHEKATSQDDKNIYFIVESNLSKKPIGLIQLNSIDYISGTAVWGYIIGDKKERGKGIDAEAPLLLLNYAFNILNLRKLISYSLNIRPGIQRIHNKYGKTRVEGILKEHYFFNGEYYDLHIISFFKEDNTDLKYTGFFK